MRKEDLYRAIGEVDEKVLAKSQRGWKPSRVFRGALTAAACLLLAVGIGGAVFFGLGRHGQEEEPFALEASENEDLHGACRGDHQPCTDSILIGEVYYESDYAHCPAYPDDAFYTDGTLWCYDPAVGETQILSDMAARFTETQTGYYCTDVITGDIYQIQGTTLTRVAALPDYNDWLQPDGSDSEKKFVELLGDKLYYTEFFDSQSTFYELDLTDGSIRQLSEPQASVWSSTFQMWDGEIYYLTTDVTDSAVPLPPVYLHALNVETGESRVLDVELPEETYYTAEAFHYGNLLLYSASYGRTISVYQVELDQSRITKLAEPERNRDQTELFIRRDEDTVYWAINYADEEESTYFKVTEYDPDTGTMTERTEEITLSAGVTQALTIYPHSGGCYYDETWASHGDTYYYDYATGTAVCISPETPETEQGDPSVYSEISWDEYNTLLSGDTFFFSAYNYEPETAGITNAGIFCYDPAANSTTRLGDVPAVFTQAQSGDYCADITTGDVYALEGHSMKKVSALPLSEDQPELALIDVLGDTIYYHNRDAIYALDTRTETSSPRELYRVEDGSYEIQGAYLRDWVLYYWTLHQTADPEIFALDLNTGEHRKLGFTFTEGSLYRFDEIAFYEDGIFCAAALYDVTGYSHYWLDYDTLEATLLETPADGEYAIGPVSRDGDTLYWKHWHPERDDCWQVAAYDMETDTIQNWDMELPKPAEQLRVCDGGCYYVGYGQENQGVFYYDLATGETHRIDPGGDAVQSAVGTATAEPEKTLSLLRADMDEETFFDLFHELDESSMRAYLDAHPEALKNGWAYIDINESSLSATGTDIRTTAGDQVLAVNARDGVLLVRVEVESPAARGVLAICKGVGQLSLCPSEYLGKSGQTVGEICQANSGVLAMTGSAFIDDGGTGGQLSGMMVCSGTSYGTTLDSGYKRMELRADNKMYVVDADSPLGEGTRDAAEFGPAAVVDGEVLTGTGWDGVQPRALIGQSDRLEPMMLVMEGRLTDSLGCGVEECAEILKRYGCAQAMNLDGGTSAILYYKDEPVTRCSNSDLPEGRQLPSAWVYKKVE